MIFFLLFRANRTYQDAGQHRSACSICPNRVSGCVISTPTADPISFASLERVPSHMPVTLASAVAPARSAVVGFRTACGWRAGDAERVAVRRLLNQGLPPDQRFDVGILSGVAKLRLALDCNSVQSRLTTSARDSSVPASV